MRWWESGFIVGEGQGARALVILVLNEGIWNAPAVSLVFPVFKDTGSLFYPLRRVLSQWFPPWVTASHLIAGNWEAELKPTTFSSTFPGFPVFPLLLTPRFRVFECCLLGLLLNNIIIE